MANSFSASPVGTLVLGAGPAGLAAAYELSRSQSPSVLVLERADEAGGLMRSMHRGPFIVDIGRKELYSRIPEVNRLWSELLGEEYRSYSHRVGILFRGRIFERSRQFRGVRRGMPWSLFLAGGLDYVWSVLARAPFRPRSYEDFAYRKRGALFTQVLSQPFHEKFGGRRWADLPAPAATKTDFAHWARGISDRWRDAFEPSTSRGRPVEWRHPAQGTGQICTKLQHAIEEAGGRFRFGAEVTQIGVADGRIETVTAQVGQETCRLRPQHVISSLPVERLASLLWPDKTSETQSTQNVAPRRSTILVYLFLDEVPRFPHCWLHVTCPETTAGRITNYAAFGRDMVPAGKTCLCVEFFCGDQDRLLACGEHEIEALALDECARGGLIDPARCFDSFEMRLPGTNAATKLDDWLTDDRRRIVSALKQFSNLYDVNRPGTDMASYAGMQAAAAVLSGVRSRFDDIADPTTPSAVFDSPAASAQAA